MHKYIITRGKKRHVRNFIDDIEENFLPFYPKNEEGVKKKLMTQIVARPVELWELVYPEGSDNKVMKLLGAEGYQQHNFRKIIKDFLMRLIGLKKSKDPQPDITNVVPPIQRGFVGVHILGNKKDAKDKNGNEML